MFPVQQDNFSIYLTKASLYWVRLSSASLDEAKERWEEVVEAICGDAQTRECLLEAEAAELLEAVDQVRGLEN
jgi:deoxyhypusine synthase